MVLYDSNKVLSNSSLIKKFAPTVIKLNPARLKKNMIKKLTNISVFNSLPKEIWQKGFCI